MLSNKQKALVLHMISEHEWTAREAIQGILDNDIDEDNINRAEIGYSDAGARDFTVYTDYEADQAHKEYIENYIDECLLPEMPEATRGYFDYDKFEQDCKISDGRGHSLSSWDGFEYEYKVNDEWLYIYEN